MSKESGHYYDRVTGESRHSILGKNGKIRNTTIKDCREKGYLPSVTTILKILAKPELDRWKQQQVLLASMTLPRIKDESDEDYCKRVMEDAFKQVDDAADLGTRVHAALENHFQGNPWDQELKVFVDPVDAWVTKERILFQKHELRLVAADYAGTTDALIWDRSKQSAVLDFKTRKSKPQYPMNPWSSEPMQIAAYARIAGASIGCNLFISTVEPGRVEATWYDKETLDQEFECFSHVKAIWQARNNYYPQKFTLSE